MRYRFFSDRLYVDLYKTFIFIMKILIDFLFKGTPKTIKMTDVQSVVAQLQQTQKGKLKYNTNDWGNIFEEAEKPPRLKVSPFVVRNISRLATSDKVFVTSTSNEKIDKLEKQV